MARKCPYNRCDGSGLIPFLGKDGKPVPTAFTYCECHESNQPARHHYLKPEDIDFPVSYSYYRGLCREHGWVDPGDDREGGQASTLTGAPSERRIVYEHTQVTDKAIRELRSLRSDMEAVKGRRQTRSPEAGRSRVDITDRFIKG